MTGEGGGPRVDVCVGFIGWREIKSSLILRGEGVQLLLHNFVFFLYMFFANQRSTLVLHCLLSLWRVVRGSKLMHLDLIHGLFIT